MEKCEYCQKASQILELCPHCEKVWYCNESHMSRHHSQHQEDCYPAIVVEEDGCGRYWVASREISKGELIFLESALVFGPNSDSIAYNPMFPTCLGCCRKTNTSYFCSKCHWPVCSKQCEKVSQHSNFECKVFKKNKVHPSSRPEYYLYIQLLRALLLLSNDPPTFQKMLQLEPHIQPRKGHKEESQISKSFYKFATEDCNLQFDFDLVDKVVGVNRINSYSADILKPNSRKRRCTALFWQMSLLNHDCLPNTRTVIYEDPDLSLKIGLFAATDIFKGQCITQQYIPIVRGTMARRKALKEWFFDCICKRCSCPTEFQTFFSCITCSKCEKGFLCQVNSLDSLSIWKCNNSSCDSILESKKVQEIITEIEQEIEKNENSVESLEKVLKEIVSPKNPIHIHHYLAINVQYEILYKVVHALNNQRESGLIRRCVNYCKNILSVVNVLCPGSSYYRGVILYFLGNFWFTLYEMNELETQDCTISQLKEIIHEGIEIMEVEQKGSIYREMAEELETFQRALHNLHK